MIPLKTTSETLRAVMGGTSSSTYPTAVVIYHTLNRSQKPDTSEYPRGSQFATLAGTAEVTICSAPTGIDSIHIDEAYIANKDNVTTSITVFIDDGTNNQQLVSKVLQVSQSLVYNSNGGWQLI